MRLLTRYIFPRLALDLLVFFFLPLMAIGFVVARDQPLGVLLALVFVNYLLLCISFIYNDIEDREDDRLVAYKYLPPLRHILLTIGFTQNTSGKRFENPFAHGLISSRVGYFLLFVIGLIVFATTALVGNIFTLVVVGFNILLGLAYSGVGLRLKSRPVLDVVSHGLLLAFVQVASFVTLVGSIGFIELTILVSVTVISFGSALENQYRDFNDDMNAGLANTASVIGRTTTKFLARTLQISASIATLALVGYLLVAG